MGVFCLSGVSNGICRIHDWHGSVVLIQYLSTDAIFCSGVIGSTFEGFRGCILGSAIAQDTMMVPGNVDPNCLPAAGTSPRPCSNDWFSAHSPVWGHASNACGTQMPPTMPCSTPPPWRSNAFNSPSQRPQTHAGAGSTDFTAPLIFQTLGREQTVRLADDLVSMFSLNEFQTFWSRLSEVAGVLPLISGQMEARIRLQTHMREEAEPRGPGVIGGPIAQR